MRKESLSVIKTTKMLNNVKQLRECENFHQCNSSQCVLFLFVMENSEHSIQTAIVILKRIL